MTETPTEASHTRGEALLATRNRKMADLFQDKTFTIIQEVHLGEGEGVFRTPFGHKGRNGYVLQQMDASGQQVILEADQDWEGGKKAGEPNAFVIGASVLKVANEDYHAIQNMPEPPARRRGRKAADEAEASSEPEPANA